MRGQSVCSAGIRPADQPGKVMEAAERRSTHPNATIKRRTASQIRGTRLRTGLSIYLTPLSCCCFQPPPPFLPDPAVVQRTRPAPSTTLPRRSHGFLCLPSAPAHKKCPRSATDPNSPVASVPCSHPSQQEPVQFGFCPPIPPFSDQSCSSKSHFYQEETCSRFLVRGRSET